MSGLRTLVAPLMLALSACGGGADNKASNDTNAASGNAAAATPADRPLMAMMGDRGDLATLTGLARGAGLEAVLGGVGPYTIFAPVDAAFEPLGGERTETLKGETMRPQAAALVRAHIVPGSLTRADLAAALDRAQGQPVRMRNMAGGMLSFQRDGDGIVVTTEDGGRGRLSGEEARASNGAIQPIDGLLVRAVQ
jgi:uncharacterized surface protein with fasciclin (FAS1) repeats